MLVQNQNTTPPYVAHLLYWFYFDAKLNSNGPSGYGDLERTNSYLITKTWEISKFWKIWKFCSKIKFNPCCTPRTLVLFRCQIVIATAERFRRYGAYKLSLTDKRTDRRTDGQAETYIPPLHGG